MTYQEQLARDLDAATSDGELFARTQLATVAQYLSEGLRFSSEELRALFEDILAETVPNEKPALTLIHGGATYIQ